MKLNELFKASCEIARKEMTADAAVELAKLRQIYTTGGWKAASEVLQMIEDRLEQAMMHARQAGYSYD